MIRVHMDPDISATPVDFARCDGWDHNEDTGTLTVEEAGETMATFSPGSWVYVEDIPAETDAQVPA